MRIFQALFIIFIVSLSNISKADNIENSAQWKKLTECRGSKGQGISPLGAALDKKEPYFYEDVPADDHILTLLKRNLFGKTEYEINTFTRGKWYSSTSEGKVVPLLDDEDTKVIFEGTKSSVYTYQFRINASGSGYVLWTQHNFTFGRISAYYATCS